MKNNLPDPITGEDRVMVRQPVTGSEQGVAAFTGFFTAGPLGALLAWGAIRGLQGRWTPWFILGMPATVLVNAFYAFLLVSLGILSTDTYKPEPKDAMIIPSNEIHHL